MSKYSTELALFFQVKSLANLLVLESQLKEIGELEILKTQNWQVENNCRNDMEFLKKLRKLLKTIALSVYKMHFVNLMSLMTLKDTKWS